MSSSLVEAVQAARTLRELTWADVTDDRMVQRLVAAAGRAGAPPVNTALYSPRGSGVASVRHGIGRAEPVASPHLAGEPEPQDGGGPELRVLGADAIRRLRGHRCVVVDEHTWGTPYAAATVVIELCCAGVTVLTRGLSATVRSMVAPEVLAVADDVSEQAVLDPSRREALSIAVRRRAHRVYGFQAPGDDSFPTISVLVPATELEQAQPLLDQVAAQSWPQVQVHQVHADADPQAVLDEVIEAGAVYVSRMTPGIAYGPHHLEDLVQALRHSGAALAVSPTRFTHEPQAGVLLEHPGLILEDAGPPQDRTMADSLPPGLALWYAVDGTDGPPTGPSYHVHGCSAVLLPTQQHLTRATVHMVHRRHPAQLEWFRPSRAEPTRPSHRSYFAEASTAVRS